MKHLFAAFALLALLIGGASYLHNLSWQQGYATAHAKGEAALKKLEHQHALATLHHAQQARKQLEDALTASHQAERQYLHQQQQLNAHTAQLKEQLTHALNNQPACHFTSSWVRHYQAALGVPTAPPTATSAPSATATPTTAASPASLLQHAQAYGHWCKATTQQLTALQQLIRQHPHGN